MTQPWWPGAGEPPAPVGSSNPTPGVPPQPQGQNRQQGQNYPQQATPWAPPPTTQTATPPDDRSGAAVNTVAGAAGGPTAPGGQQPPSAPTVPGLGFVNFLLVMGTLAFAAFVARDWVVDWLMSVDPCLDGGGAWECVVNDAGRTQVLLPLVAVLAALSLARGAAVERRQGRGIGYLYAVLGFGIVGLAWSIGAGA